MEDTTFAAWAEVVDYLEWLGGELGDSADRRQAVLIAMEATAQHDAFLLERFWRGSDTAPGLTQIPAVHTHGSSDGPKVRICILIFSFDEADANTAVGMYPQAGIGVRARNMDVYSGRVLKALGCGPVIRISTCHYITPAEVDTFLETTGVIAASGERSPSSARPAL